MNHQRVLGRSNIKITQIIMGTWKADKTRWVDVDDLADKCQDIGYPSLRVNYAST